MKIISFTVNGVKKYVKDYKFDITGHSLTASDFIEDAILVPDNEPILIHCILNLVELTYGKCPMEVSNAK